MKISAFFVLTTEFSAEFHGSFMDFVLSYSKPFVFLQDLLKCL